jgi:hypothetical protein
VASVVSATAPALPGRSGDSRRAEWLLLSCSTGAILGLLATTELSLRAAAPDDLTGPAAMERLHRPSEVYGWEPRPGFAARIEGMRTTIDGRGARGPEADDEAADSRRILMLGDSIAFGWGVHDEETFAALLDSGARTSVLNLAVEGYGLDQTLLRFEREGASFRPHVIVLSFCVANDFVDTALPAFLYDGLTPKPYFRLEGDGLRLHDEHLRRPLRERAASHLQERFEIFRWARGRWREPPPSTPHWADVARQVTERSPQALELTLRLLERIAAQTRSAGAELVLLVHPNQRSYRQDGLEADLLGSPRLEDVTVVDLREWYGQRNLDFRDVALDRMGHLSPAGHREVAEVVRLLIEG